MVKREAGSRGQHMQGLWNDSKGLDSAKPLSPHYANTCVKAPSQGERKYRFPNVFDHCRELRYRYLK